MTRPKSTIPKSRSSSSGATIANSTMDCERCPPPPFWTSTISVAADCHVRVRHHVDRGTQDTFHELCRQAEVHDQDHVYIRAPVAVVVWGGGQIQAGGVRITDVEKRLVHARCRIGRVGVWRVVNAVAVGDVGTGRARVLQLRGWEAGVIQNGIDGALDGPVVQVRVGASGGVEPYRLPRSLSRRASQTDAKVKGTTEVDQAEQKQDEDDRRGAEFDCGLAALVLFAHRAIRP